jgi:general secretion pathway protein J
MSKRNAARRANRHGFTLIELLVALAIMAVLALLSGRALDGMTRAQALTQARADEVLTLQAGLGQWAADLDALFQTQRVSALDYDGRVLRLTRRDSASADALRVVAWSQRSVQGRLRWLRWQSPALYSRGDLQQAWQQAQLWAQNPSDEARRNEVAVADIDAWQIFYFRSDGWTNPQSTSVQSQTPQGAAALTEVPDGVRLVLTLAPGQALSGTLTRDWIRPTLGGGKS